MWNSLAQTAWLQLCWERAPEMMCFSRASVSSVQADKMICSALFSDAWLFLNSLKVQAAMGIFSMANFRLGFQNRLWLKKVVGYSSQLLLG